MVWRTTVGSYALGKVVGEGAYSKVRLGTHSKTGAKVAVKVIKVSSLQASAPVLRTIQREVILLTVMHHPNVVRLFDVVQTKTHLYVVMEYVSGGDLWFLIQRERLSLEQAFGYFYAIVGALDYCHSCCICHRDLKPENILLDEHGTIKLADFGLAAIMIRDRPLETRCGSMQYASPELLKKPSKYDGTKADVWSLGVVFYVLCTGVLPFDEEKIGVLLRKIRTADYIMPASFSVEHSGFVASMLTISPIRRASLAQLRRHPFWRTMCSSLGLPLIPA
eukprot:RCo000189